MTAFLIILSGTSSNVFAESAILNRPQPELEGVGVEEKLGDQVTLQAHFMNENGAGVQLNDYFKSNRPVILSLNYFTCPQLCSLQLNGLTRTMKKIPWKAGNEFVFVSVSYDPTETAEQAKLQKTKYLRDYGQSTSNEGWNFLVGRRDYIKRLAGELGISYKYLRNKRQYSHPAALVLCTPDGKISSYIHGVDMTPESLQEALQTAAAGNIAKPKKPGSIWPMFCAVYDAEAGVYVVSAIRIMQVSGVLLIIAFGSLWWFCQHLVHSKEKEKVAVSEVVSEAV